MPRAWQHLAARERLSLRHTLQNGQCFCWLPGSGVPGEPGVSREPGVARSPARTNFVGVVGRWAVQLEERGDDVVFRVLNAREASPGETAEGPLRALRDYFQLDVDTALLYRRWGGGCERLRKVGECLPGMRVLRQDPLECLLSFICSSNNNVARIAGMIGRLREEFGSPMAVGAAGIGRDTPLRLFSFPTLEQLSAASEERLRELGFGYRAKFVTKTVSKLRSEEFGGTAWLERLRGLPQSAENVKSVRTELQRLDGVGPKVADCVALFALDRRGAIPVDTHVWQIACRDFDRQLLDAKSLTPAVYDRVGDLFRERYGEYAGWAHCLLFAAELPLFQDTLPEDMVTEMKAFAKLEKERKAQAKAAKAGRNTSRAGKVKKETGLASAAITVAKVAKTKATSKAKRMSKEKTKTVMKAKRKAVEPAPTPAPAQRRYTRRRRT